MYLAKALDLTIDSNIKEESEKGGQEFKKAMSLTTSAQIYTQNNYLADTNKLAENKQPDVNVVPEIKQEIPMIENSFNPPGGLRTIPLSTDGPLSFAPTTE